MPHEGHKRREHAGRDDLAGEHKVSDIGQIILFILFIAANVIDIFWLNYSDWLRITVSYSIRIPVAAVILIPSGLMARSGLKTVFHDKRDQLEVISTGVFGLVRHPIYLSSLMLYLGILILTLSMPALIIFLFAVVFYYFISRYEEQILIEKLGDRYREYMKAVPMFIPRLFKRRK